ncbi:hypothetical protein BKA70DRAFT_1104613 [Coprinopsis sp. MPI-PUGE-AT-0042]|nr:hypothetical protein BKA70DRAFT_1104613 [Coprinopsis sp. MPI-PUGE-AT-0042]
MSQTLLADQQGIRVPAFTRFPYLWFDDGNIIFQVETTQFRVHKSILLSHFEVIATMLSLPQPETPETPFVEGCPVVILQGDKAEDWHDVLKYVIYDGFRSLRSRSNISFVRAALTIADKYDCQHITREMKDRLEMTFPSTLAEYHSQQRQDWVIIDGDNSQWDVINLAVEFKVLACLPYLYCLCLQHWNDVLLIQGSTSRTGKVTRLLPEAQNAMLFGRHLLYQSVSRHQFLFLQSRFLLMLVPCTACPTKVSCVSARERIRQKLWDPVPDLKVAMAPVDATTIALGLCGLCREAARASFKQGQAQCWDELPMVFGLPGWDELLKEEGGQ